MTQYRRLDILIMTNKSWEEEESTPMPLSFSSQELNGNAEKPNLLGNRYNVHCPGCMYVYKDIPPPFTPPPPTTST